MFAACILLLIAVLGGTLLTFLFDRGASLGARVCMGACIGPALLATVGFLSALWLGLGPGCIVLSASVLLLPILLLNRSAYRQPVSDSIGAAKGSISSSPGRRTAAYVFFYFALAVLLGMVFSRAAYERPDGIFTGLANNLGDLPMHLQVIAS